MTGREYYRSLSNEQLAKELGVLCLALMIYTVHHHEESPAELIQSVLDEEWRADHDLRRD